MEADNIMNLFFLSIIFIALSGVSVGIIQSTIPAAHFNSNNSTRTNSESMTWNILLIMPFIVIIGAVAIAISGMTIEGRDHDIERSDPWEEPITS